MITPQQLRNPQVKPKWQLPAGVMESVVAFNCRKYGMPLPVLALPMWEGAGNRALDYSGHGNHGTFTNIPEWVNDGINFPGTDDYIDCAHSASLDITDKISVFAMIKMTANGSYPTICSKGLYQQSYSMMFNVGTRVPRLYINGTGYHGTTAVELNKESSLLYTYGNGYARTYIDGVRGLNQVATPAINSTATDLYIGAITTIYEFFGDMYVLIIFNTVLTGRQARFLHDNPYFMYEIPEELYGYVVAVAAEANPYWYYQMLRRRN